LITVLQYAIFIGNNFADGNSPLCCTLYGLDSLYLSQLSHSSF